MTYTSWVQTPELFTIGRRRYHTLIPRRCFEKIRAQWCHLWRSCVAGVPLFLCLPTCTPFCLSDFKHQQQKKRAEWLWSASAFPCSTILRRPYIGQNVFNFSSSLSRPAPAPSNSTSNLFNTRYLYPLNYHQPKQFAAWIKPFPLKVRKDSFYCRQAPSESLDYV